MNDRGNLILVILAVFAMIGIGIVLLANIFPQAKFLISLILVFQIYTAVKSYLGDSILTIIFSGILIYFLVVKYFNETLVLYIFFFVLMSLQVLSLFIWGIGSTVGRHIK